MDDGGLTTDDLISRAHVKALVNGMWWETIDSIPAVDAVEVVRCSDCVHFEPFRQHDGFCKIDTMLRENDFFCKYGQRREDGDV